MLTRRAALLPLCTGLAACARTATPPAGPTALPLPPKRHRRRPRPQA
ncbi:hypothetical protein [Hankyongella ginsenosidimutans]|nr:hypothetical protein [Hankyongella ginsenosidimutans]